MQEQFNKRFLTVHERMTNMVFDQLEQQLEILNTNCIQNVHNKTSNDKMESAENNMNNIQGTQCNTNAQNAYASTPQNAQPSVNCESTEGERIKHNGDQINNIGLHPYMIPPPTYVAPQPQRNQSVPVRLHSGTIPPSTFVEPQLQRYQNVPDRPSTYQHATYPQFIRTPTNMINSSLGMRQLTPTLPVVYHQHTYPFLHIGRPLIRR